MPEGEVRKLLRTLVNTLSYMKSIGIFHAALSPDHILVKKGLKGEISYLIGGIEHCILFDDGDDIAQTIKDFTDPYIFPELQSGSFSLVDFDNLYSYSLGVMVYSLLTGIQQFPRENNALVQRLNEIPGISAEAKDFLICTLRPHNQSMLGLKDIMKSHFYQDKKIIYHSVKLPPYKRYKWVSPIWTNNDRGCKVYRAMDIITNEEVTIKLSNIGEGFDREKHRTMAEADIITILQGSPFFPTVRSIERHNEQVYMIMENNNGHSLTEHFRTIGKISEEEAIIVAWFISTALYDMHKLHHMTHRDVNPNNIIVNTNGITIARAFLIDFNISKSASTLIGPVSALGTDGYIAPEIYEVKMGKRKFYNNKCDVWSFGMVLYYLLYFKNLDQDVVQSIIKDKENNLKQFAGLASPDYINLMSRCLVYSPDDRILIEDIVDHPLFNCINKISKRPSLNPYEIIKQIDTNIFKCKNTETNLEFAMIKYPSYAKDKKVNKLKRSIQSVKYLQGLGFIAKLFDYFEVDSDLYIIREYCDEPNDSLKNVVKSPSYTADDAKTYIREMANDINILHSLHFCHRNLNSSSFAIVTGNKLKIKDYDLARVIYKDGGSIIGFKDSSYIAPENLISKKETSINFQSDIWSFGMLLYFLNYRVEFDENKASIAILQSEGRVQPPGVALFPQLNELMDACLSKVRANRPKIKEIISMLDSIFGVEEMMQKKT